MARASNIKRSLHIAAAVGALLGSVIAGPVAAEPILPVEPGTTWEYEVRESASRGGPSSPLTVRISGREERAGKQLLKVETLAGDDVVKTELISVDDAGVHCHERAGADGKAVPFVPPQTMVPAPLRLGATWEINDHVAGTGPQQFTAAAEEEVVVPAGTFAAVRLRCEQPWPISTTLDRWFAPGTGVVKEVSTTRGPTGRLLSRTTTQLKNFAINAPPPSPEEAPSITIDPASPAVAPPAASPPGPGILLEVAAERDGEARFEFKSDAPQIFVRWSGINLPVGDYVRVAWIAEDVGDVAPPNFIVDQTETRVASEEFGARFTLSRPKDGWAAGKYRVELYLEDELLQKVNVTIAD